MPNSEHLPESGANLGGAAQLGFMPMSALDLDVVLTIEAQSHLHPWTRGNFSDSLASGHWAYCIRPEVEQAVEGSLLDPMALWAYCVLFPAVDELHLLNITVAPSLRRHGIAARMMAAIEGVAAQQQMPRIILEVRPSNTGAVMLYEKMGYQSIGRRKNYKI